MRRALLLLLLAASPAFAEGERLLGELRCLVCAGESVASSNAAWAEDVRALVRERLAAGEDEAAIKRFLVSRYGEAILLDPPFSSRSAALWAMPMLLLALGAVALWRRRTAC